MAEFIEKEVLTVADYDLYCHYVAGLVGIGLSQVLSSALVIKLNGIKYIPTTCSFYRMEADIHKGASMDVHCQHSSYEQGKPCTCEACEYLSDYASVC